MSRTVLITGAAGYLGRQLVARLAADPAWRVVATDLRDVDAGARVPEVVYRTCDVRAPALAEIVAREQPTVVVHLAAVVDGRQVPRALAYEIDVVGTENVLRASIDHGVRRLVVTSSGAAYGYRADHPRWLTETDPLRAEKAFAYAHHKRQVEERLAAARDAHPVLEQVVFRVGTILGRTTRNQITDLFDRPLLLGVRGGDDRFVFVWDQDVVEALVRALDCRATGVFNLAGDGALSMAELATRMGKRYLRLPAAPLRLALRLGRLARLVRYGPEQVRFLQYRPVLDNRKLAEVFGFRPPHDSATAFEQFWRARREGAG